MATLGEETVSEEGKIKESLKKAWKNWHENGDVSVFEEIEKKINEANEKYPEYVTLGFHELATLVREKNNWFVDWLGTPKKEMLHKDRTSYDKKRCEACVQVMSCDAYREANLVGAYIDSCNSFEEYPGAYEDPNPKGYTPKLESEGKE